MVDKVRYNNDPEYKAQILERNRLYKQRNREKVLEAKRKRRLVNPEKVALEKRLSRSKNQEKYDNRVKKWKEDNKEQQLKYFARYNEENKEKRSEAKKNCYNSNPEHYKSKSSQWFERNKESRRATARSYYEANKEKYIFKAFLRKKKIKRATPSWLTNEMKTEMKHLFDTRPEGYHVDHMIPLQGETVCGLNVPWNLQHMKDIENISKGNKLIIHPSGTPVLRYHPISLSPTL